MGLFGGNKSSKKASRELRKGINQAQSSTDAAYGNLLTALPGQYNQVTGILGQGRDATLGAIDQGYTLAQGNYNQALQALADSYGVARGDVESALAAQRGDIRTSLASQLAAIDAAHRGAVGYYQPYIQAGQPALSRLTALTTPGDTSFQADPGYLWRRGQGMDVIQNSAAGKGGALGGNTLKALQEFGQNFATQEYGNVYNRNLGLAQMGLGASQGAAGVEQWAGGAGAGANQWAGGMNADANRWAGNLNTTLASQYGQNRANNYSQQADLGYRYGNNRAGVLSDYYGNLGQLTGGYNQQLNTANLARAQNAAGYDMQRANASAAREASQGGWGDSLMSLGGMAAGAFLGGSGGLLGGLGSSAGKWLANQAGLSTGGYNSMPAQGYYGYNVNNNPWLTGRWS